MSPFNSDNWNWNDKYPVKKSIEGQVEEIHEICKRILEQNRKILKLLEEVKK